MVRLALFVILAVLISSCQKEELIGPQYLEVSEIDFFGDDLLLIGCEGNFQVGNASLSTHDLVSRETNQQVYRSVNEEAIGDIVQSIYRTGDSLLVVVNNSGLIRILIDSTFEEIGVVEGLTSPRYMEKVEGSKWIVSSYGGESLTLIYLKSLEIDQIIESGLWTDGMLRVDDQLYVHNRTDSTLMVYKLPALNLLREIKLAFDPIYSGLDELGHPWFAGPAEGGSAITQVQSDTLMVVAKLDTPISGMRFYQGRYFILSKERLVILDASFNTVGGYEHGASLPYGLHVSEDGVFVADAKDFISSGEVFHYGHDQLLKHIIPTGVIPQAMIKINY